MIVVEVEAGLADRHDARMPCPAAEPFEERIVDQLCVVGMNADDGMTVGLALGDLERAEIGGDASAGGGDDQLANSGRPRPREHRGTIRVGFRLSYVTVRIDDRDPVSDAARP